MEKREIKFEAWHKKNKRFIKQMELPDILIHIDGKIYMSESASVYDDLEQTDEFILRQYTGLKDKEGKEIYEGDVVNVKRYGNKKWETGKVIWDNYFHSIKCKYSNTPKSGTYGIRWEEVIDSEIIGNIYENPELI